jgi:hypothetical protein
MAFFGTNKKLEPKIEPPPLALAPAAAASARRYGIEDAIHLMRKLPLDQNVELILLVIRNTLNSMNVSMKDVIDDGSAKQERLRTNLAGLEATISALEKEMQIRRQEMEAVEADLAETTLVKQRLEMAAERESTIMQPLAVPSPSPKPTNSPPKPNRRAPTPASATSAESHAGVVELEVEPMPDSIQVPVFDKGAD